MKLFRECEHELNDTYCHVMCEAYERGDGMIDVEPAVIQELCIYHHRPKVRKGMAHCEAVWTENAAYPDGDCVTARFALVRVPKEDNDE